MLTDSYTVEFIYSSYNGKLNIPLTADILSHHSEPYYIVQNVRASLGSQHPVFSQVQLKKVNGHWVHRDSLKETDLSVSIGRAVEEYERGRKE
jgi:hypothetical protein